MPSIYRFGFEGGVIPEGVTVSNGSTLSTLTTTDAIDVPYGSLDFLFVIDVTTKSSRELVEGMIANASLFFEKFEYSTVLRIGIATVGQYQGDPYINFYGWTLCNPVAYSSWTTSGTDIGLDSYFLDKEYPAGANAVVKTLMTVLDEIDVLSGTDRIDIPSWWTEQVLIPFLYGRFSSGFGTWSQGNSSPQKKIIPDPVLPLFYAKIGGNREINPAWTLYTPYVKTQSGQFVSGVSWGFRLSSEERGSSYWERVLLYPPAELDGEHTQDERQVNATRSQTVFVSDSSDWPGFESVDSEFISVWSEVHRVAFTVPQSSRFQEYSQKYNATVKDFDAGKFAWTWGIDKTYGTTSMSNTGTWCHGRCHVELDSLPAVSGRFQVRQEGTSLNPAEGTWTLLEVGNVRVDAASGSISVYVDNNLVNTTTCPAIVQNSSAEFTFLYTPALFKASLDGNEVVVPAELTDGFLANVDHAVIGGIPYFDNVALNSLDERYSRRYTGKYDSRPQDFNGLDTGIPDPVKGSSVIGFVPYVHSGFADRGSAWDGTPGGYVSHSMTVDHIQHRDMSVEGVNMAYSVSKLAGVGSSAPLELGIQTSAYKRTMASIMAIGSTPRGASGSAFYDENASKLTSYQVRDLFSRVEVTTRYAEGLWLSTYDSEDIHVDTSGIDSLSDYPISELGDAVAILRQNPILGVIRGYINTSSGILRFLVSSTSDALLKIDSSTLLDTMLGVHDDALQLASGYHEFELRVVGTESLELTLSCRTDEELVSVAYSSDDAVLEYDIYATLDGIQLIGSSNGSEHTFVASSDGVMYVFHEVPVVVSVGGIDSISYDSPYTMNVSSGELITVAIQGDASYTVKTSAVDVQFKQKEYMEVPQSLYYRDAESPSAYPELHGWRPIESLKVGTKIEDSTISEGDKWLFTIPDGAFVGVTSETSYTTLVQSTVSQSADSSWISFNDESATFSGSPNNENVGHYKITVIARGARGGFASQSFYLTVLNTNTAPFVIDDVPDQVVHEEHVSYLDLSSYFGDDDIIHGDILRYSLYSETLQDQDALITPDFCITIVLDNSGVMRGTASTIKSMVESGLISRDLKELYGESYSVLVRTVYAGEYWVESLRNVQQGTKQLVIVVGDEDGDYDTNVDKSIGDDVAQLVSTISTMDRYYGLVLSVGSGSPSIQDRFEFLAAEYADFKSSVESGKIILSRNVELDREENYYYLIIKYALGNAGLYIERGYNTPPAWATINGPIVEFSPEFGQLGVYHMIARATDKEGLRAESRFDVESLATYHAPVLTHPIDEIQYVRGLTLSAAISEMFTDADTVRGDVLTPTVEGLPDWCSWNPDLRLLSGQAPEDGSETYDLTYSVTDLQGHVGTHAFQLVAVEGPKVASDIGDRVVAYNASFQVNLSSIFSYDLDLSYSVRIMRNGVEIYTPDWIVINAGYVSVNSPGVYSIDHYSVSITATAENMAYAISTFSLDVIDTAPTYIGGLDGISIGYSSTFSKDLSGSFFDPEGQDTLTFSAQELPAWAELSGSRITGVPGVQNIGSHAFTVVATDEAGRNVSHSFSASVSNSLPTISQIPSISVEIGHALSLSIADRISDDDGDTPRIEVKYYSGSSEIDDSWITFDEGTATFSGTPEIVDIGLTTVIITAIDEAGGQTSSQFVVEAYNLPHVLNAVPDVSINYLVPWSVDLSNVFGITFPELADWELEMPAWMSWDYSTKVLSGTPSADEVGTHAVSVTVNETILGNTRSANDEFVVTVINRKPVKVHDIENRSIPYNSPAFYVYVGDTFDDPDVDAYSELEWSFSGPSWTSFDIDSKTISGTPGTGVVGTHTITISVYDRFGASASATFYVTVVNMPPFVNEPVQNSTMRYVDTLVVDVSNVFSDPESLSSLTVTAPEVPSWINFDGVNKRLTFTPGPENVGTTTVRLVAVDECGSSAETSFAVSVTNQKPFLNGTLADKTVIVQAPFSLNVSGSFTDPETGDDSNLAYTVSYFKDGSAYNPTWLTFNPSTRSFSGTPTSLSVAVFQVYVTVHDPAGGEAWSSFTLTVKDVDNYPPELVVPIPDQSIYALTGWTYDFNGAFTDPDDAASTLLYSDSWKDSTGLSIARPSWVVFNQAARTYTAVPPESAIGFYDVTLRCTGRYGRYVEDTFRVTVVPPRGVVCGSIIQAPRDVYNRPLTSSGQVVTTEIALGPNAGLVSIIFDGQTWYDTVTFYYNGSAIALEDYDRTIVNGVVTKVPVYRTELRAGRDWDGQLPSDVSSKQWTWQYPASGSNNLIAVVTNGSGSVSWSLMVKCPV